MGISAKVSDSHCQLRAFDRDREVKQIPNRMTARLADRESFLYANLMNLGPGRFVQTLRTECLDHFVVVGERHLRHLCDEFSVHYLNDRPHQGIGNVPIIRGPEPPDTLPFPSKIECRERLGGLLKSYARVA